MSSLHAKAERLQRIEIESDEEFVLVIKRKGTISTVCEAIINVQELEYRPMSSQSKLHLNVINLNPILGQATTITYLPTEL